MLETITKFIFSLIISTAEIKLVFNYLNKIDYEEPGIRSNKIIALSLSMFLAIIFSTINSFVIIKLL